MREIDLHIHTTASDGTDSPAEVVRRASEMGLRAIAITDHDTVNGYAEAFSAGLDHGLEVVPGIEVSTKYGVAVHILGYYIENLVPLLAGVVNDRDRRNEKVAALMAASSEENWYEPSPKPSSLSSRNDTLPAKSTLDCSSPLNESLSFRRSAVTCALLMAVSGSSAPFI